MYEKFQNRADNLERTEKDLNKETATDYYAKGRPDACKGIHVILDFFLEMRLEIILFFHFFFFKFTSILYMADKSWMKKERSSFTMAKDLTNCLLSKCTRCTFLRSTSAAMIGYTIGKPGIFLFQA